MGGRPIGRPFFLPAQWLAVSYPARAAAVPFRALKTMVLQR